MEDTIIVLSDREKVRSRPGMYIGDNDKLGLMTIVREIIDNAYDEYTNYPDKTKPIEITLYDDNSFKVRDYGRGLSPYMSSKHHEIEERLAFNRIGAGGKFLENRDKNGNTFSAGLHGTGASATNFMSEYFNVTIYKDGKIFYDEYVDGGQPNIKVTGNSLPVRGKTDETGTEIHFKPDKTVLTETKIDAQMVHKYLMRMSYLHPKLTVTFNNLRDETSVTYYSENGLLDYIYDLSDGDKFIIEPFTFDGEMQTTVLNTKVTMKLNMALGFSLESNALYAFTNDAYNSLGGEHVNGFKHGLIKLLKYYYNEFATKLHTPQSQIAFINKVNNTKNPLDNLNASAVLNNVYAIIDFKHTNPILHPQTKDRLASKEASPMVEQFVLMKSKTYLDKHPGGVQKLLDHYLKIIYQNVKNKEQSIKLKPKEEKTLKSSKLAEAKTHGANSELFLVEGDSAAGSLKTNRDSSYQAILPLRGKVLNAERATTAKIYQNTELTTLIATLGCSFGKYYNYDKLRYGKIIIATDQDDDGLHIRTLLLTFFAKYMPELLINGNIYYLDTPLFVNTLANKEVYTYSLKEQQQLLKSAKVKEVSRNKGLGELSHKQVIDTILNSHTRRLTQIKVDDIDEFTQVVSSLMGSDTSHRKLLLESW